MLGWRLPPSVGPSASADIHGGDSSKRIFVRSKSYPAMFVALNREMAKDPRPLRKNIPEDILNKLLGGDRVAASVSKSLRSNKTIRDLDAMAYFLSAVCFFFAPLPLFLLVDRLGEMTAATRSRMSPEL